ncbi:hypothetical protein E4413_03275 [Leptospira interrogans]|uniref:hypothetical protein n=1 Tax=Leptospira interrogans TaxID=173 RepID=UPI0010C00B6C|nr:hypothetical protein [Leptospira interrogans]QCO38399.1 hypothetical protein E4412_15375 [Leptospira interrogans]QCO40059.1 hypothetical protein E4413_03275 [Leptospira interrogans]
MRVCTLEKKARFFQGSGRTLRDDVWVGFSIDTFVNHCPILSPEEEQDLKDFESSHPGQGEQ